MEPYKKFKHMKKPTFSVILPVFNGERYLRTAIESILSQSYHDYEFIIIDDGSTDKSRKVIDSFSDKRIIKIVQKKNLGLISTLNHGLKIAQGNYIARMDQDDLSDPSRLEKQLKALQSSGELAVVGSLYAAIDENSKFITVAAQPIGIHDIRFGLTSQNCFGHGSIVIDRSKIPSELLKYPEEYEHAEDYALWVMLSYQNIKMYNVPEILYSWRYHSRSISNTASREQQETVNRILYLQNSRRLDFGFIDIWTFFINAFFRLPDKMVYKNRVVKSNLKKTYQYILIQYAVKVFGERPLRSFMAIFLSLIISPVNILQKIIYK